MNDNELKSFDWLAAHSVTITVDYVPSEAIAILTGALAAMTEYNELESVVVELRYAGEDSSQTRVKFLPSALREGTVLSLGNAELHLRLGNHTLATIAGPDPGNTDPEKLTAPLDPDDDVYTAIQRARTAPAGEDPK